MPKRVVGGEYLLDLSSIEIEKSEDGTKTNITDANVLEQLTNLKKYVPNPNGIKPVWIKMKNGETGELIVARGTFANVGTGEFEICVLLNGYKLIISIEFTQALNEDEQPIDDWYIAENDAKYLFTSDYKRVVVEDVKNIDDNILSTLQCGDVVIKHDESGEHAYVVSFKSETGICLTYADASCVETQSYDYVDGTGWVYNSEDIATMNTNGELTKSWNGVITMPSGIQVVASFCKAVRNFNELQFILNCRLTNTTDETITIANDTQLANFSLPDEILEKIYGHTGVSLKDTTSNESIAYSTLYISGVAGSFSGVKYCNLFFAVGSKEIRFYLEGSTITIDSGGSIDLEVRISLAL